MPNKESMKRAADVVLRQGDVLPAHEVQSGSMVRDRGDYLVRIAFAFGVRPWCAWGSRRLLAWSTQQRLMEFVGGGLTERDCTAERLRQLAEGFEKRFGVCEETEFSEATIPVGSRAGS